MDARGHLVLGEGGGALAIPANAAKIEIDAGGEVRADGKAIGRLRVERPTPGATLIHAGDTLFEAGATESVPPTDRLLRQGAREGSNVNSIESMVDMITIQRATASVQKALTTLDAARGIAVSEIGKSAS